MCFPRTANGPRVSPASRAMCGKWSQKVKKVHYSSSAPQGLSVLKPEDENLPFMLILQICLLQQGLLNTFFQCQDLTLWNLISPRDLNLAYFDGRFDKCGVQQETVSDLSSGYMSWFNGLVCGMTLVMKCWSLSDSFFFNFRVTCLFSPRVENMKDTSIHSVYNNILAGKLLTEELPRILSGRFSVLFYVLNQILNVKHLPHWTKNTLTSDISLQSERVKSVPRVYSVKWLSSSHSSLTA